MGNRGYLVTSVSSHRREAPVFIVMFEFERQREIMRESLNLEETRILFKMEAETDYLQRRPFAI